MGESIDLKMERSLVAVVRFAWLPCTVSIKKTPGIDRLGAGKIINYEKCQEAV
jgi:hypothetical protein